MDSEDSLRRVLRPEDPGEGFTAGVMARIAEGQRQKRSRAWPMALAASALIALVGLGLLQQRQAKLRRIETTQQLALALEITSAQLNQVQQRLSRHSREENGT